MSHLVLNCEMENTNLSTENEEDLFYFESDHLALRGNGDYSELLKAMFVLEAQRIRALQDYNKVVEIKKECLKDPLTYDEKKVDGSLNLPAMLQIADIPKINWSKYNTNVPEQFMRQINSTLIDSKPDSRQPEKTSKPWTPEEQRKLEELLIKYPPEDVERHRVQKIANELGTRSRQQVASRLQKYFLKLMKAGLPVPGRIPKASSKYYERKNPYKKSNNPRHYHRKYLKPTTYFPDTIIPVVMDDVQDVPGPSASPYDFQITKTKEPIQNNYLLSNNYHTDQQSTIKDRDIEIDLLKWVKEEKIRESQQTTLFHHYGYQCDYCEEEPIQGSRWHCTTCINNSKDFCTDCILSQFYSNSSHDLRHKFLVIRNENDVSNGPWSDSDSESDSDENSSRSNDFIDEEDTTNDTIENSPSIISSGNHIENISSECPSDIFEPSYLNGNS